MRVSFGGFRVGYWWYMAAGLVLLVAFVSFGLFRGSAPLEWRDVLAVLARRLLPGEHDPADPRLDAIVWSLRAPRVVVAAMVGGCLALAGAQMQGLFRNPLASPGIVGTSTGAATGAVFALTFGLAGGFLLAAPLFAVAGAVLSLLIVTRIATRDGYTPVTTLLLAGVALNALLGAVNSWLIARSWEQYEAARRIAFWMMGGVTDRGWVHAGMILPGMIAGCAIAVWFARDLDLLLEGEEVAASLGVDVELAKRAVLWSAAILTGSAVAVSGVVGFVGLVVPHLVRLLLGPVHRRLLPAAFLTGAWFVVGADLLARTVAAPREVFLGVVTAFVGAPFFLYLLVRHEGEVAVSR